MERHATCPSQPGFPRLFVKMVKNCKKTGSKYQWAHFLTKRMVARSLKTIEGWERKMQGKGRLTGSYKMMPFKGIRSQACKQDSYSERIRQKEIKNRGEIYSLQNTGVLQRASWCTKPYHFVWRKFHLHPFCRGRFARPLGVNFKGDWLIDWLCNATSMAKFHHHRGSEAGSSNYGSHHGLQRKRRTSWAHRLAFFLHFPNGPGFDFQLGYAWLCWYCADYVWFPVRFHISSLRLRASWKSGVCIIICVFSCSFWFLLIHSLVPPFELQVLLSPATWVGPEAHSHFDHVSFKQNMHVHRPSQEEAKER